MLRKVRKKEVWHPPSAGDYNTMAMAAERYLAGPDRTPQRQLPIPTDVVKVKNSSGSALRLGEVIELSGFLPTDVLRASLWFDGALPDTTRPLGIALQAIPTSTIDNCQVSGACPALVNVTDAGHGYAAVSNANAVLQSAISGPVRILYKPAGTGEKTCAVLLPIASATTATMVWYRTQENWRTNAGDARVKCRKVTAAPRRTSSTTDVTDVWVYLPRTRPGDPNVVASTNLLCATDEDGSLTCISDYLDDKIGTAKLWDLTAATIPAGWGLMDGTGNSVLNGGTGITMKIGVGPLDAFARFTDSDGAVGTSGGAETATVAAHNGADVIACIADHAANNTGSVGTHAHFGTAFDATPSFSGTTGSGGSHTHGTTGLSVATAALTVDITDTGHGHGVTDTGHGHAITDAGHTHALTDPGHSHTPGDSYLTSGDGEDIAGVTLSEEQTGITMAGAATGITITSGATGLTVNSGTTGVTAAVNPSSHDHSLSGTIDNEDQHTHPFTYGHAHAVETGDAGSHSHTTPALTHAAQNPEVDLAHASINVVPPYVYLMYIERLNNSAGA